MDRVEKINQHRYRAQLAQQQRIARQQAHSRRKRFADLFRWLSARGGQRG